MRRWIPLATLLASLAASSGPALAGLPPPSNSTIPAFVRLVGGDVFGHPDSAGVFTVTVRDLANYPIAGSSVFVDFSAATDLELCDAQGAGVTLSPSGVTGITGADGKVTMTLLGHAIPGAPASSPNAVKIYADGVLLGTVPCAAFDLNGVGGVGGADLALWLGDFFTGTYRPRADYDGSGYLSGSDLSVWLRVFVRGMSAVTCPGIVVAPQ